MRIVSFSGSSRPDSSNAKLLEYMADLATEHEWKRSEIVYELPLFRAENDMHPWNEKVLKWRQEVSECDALIIATPEYLHNLPAVVKNALEWLATSGELDKKRVLAITFTPFAPRGENTMTSLLWTLSALGCQVVASLPIFQREIDLTDKLKNVETNELLVEAIKI